MRPPFDWLAPEARNVRSAIGAVERAVREGWPVPEADRPELVAALARLVESGRPQVAVRAARLLLEMDRANRAGEREARG